MQELGVQLVLVSPKGVVAPLAVSRDQDLVKHVGKHILKKWQQRKFHDSVLDLLNAEEVHRLAAILRLEGTDDEP
jgi:hypothetical protein